jgi:hypothetical protein
MASTCDKTRQQFSRWIKIPCFLEEVSMRNRCMSLVVCLVLTAGNRTAWADDQADMLKVVKKGISAIGGERNLRKYRAFTLKFKGKFYANDNGLDYTGELSIQAPAQQKVAITFDMGGQKFTFIQVINKTKGWIKQGTMEATAMPKDQLAEEKEQMYYRSLATLVPLLDKSVKLSPVGEVQIGKAEAIGVKASKQGHRDVNLYFDKKTGLLLKSETVGKQMETDKEVSLETFYEDYKARPPRRLPSTSWMIASSINRNESVSTVTIRS